MKALLLILLIPLTVMAESFNPALGTQQNLSFEGYQGFIIKPARKATGAWLWIMPAWLVGEGVFRAYIDRALECGTTVAGLEIGVTLGSPKAADLNQRYYRYLLQEFSLEGRPTLLLQSNGNTSGIAWASRHPVRVKQIIGIFPVFDLRDWPTVKYMETDTMLQAPEWKYPLTENHLRAANPIRHLEPLAQHKVPFLVVHGDADIVVHFEDNAVDAMHTYRGFGGKFKLIKIPGKGHEIAPEFHENPHVLRALIPKLPCFSQAVSDQALQPAKPWRIWNKTTE